MRIYPLVLVAFFAALVFALAGLPAAAQEPDPDLGYLQWPTPSKRVNGEYLAPDEIGGFEIRYTVDGQEHRALIEDGTATGYQLGALDPLPEPGQTVFDVAVFDTNGLFSEYAPIPAQLPSTSPPAWGTPPTYTPPPRFDPAGKCETDVFCWFAALRGLRYSE